MKLGSRRHKLLPNWNSSPYEIQNTNTVKWINRDTIKLNKKKSRALTAPANWKKPNNNGNKAKQLNTWAHKSFVNNKRKFITDTNYADWSDQQNFWNEVDILLAKDKDDTSKIALNDENGIPILDVDISGYINEYYAKIGAEFGNNITEKLGKD